MTTVNELITSSLRVIGAVASGEDAEPSEIQDALLTAKIMMDSWSNQGLLVPAYVHESFVFTGGRTYTIGTGGDINTNRPISINNVRINAGDRDVQVTIASMELWASIELKDNVVTYPDYVYYDNQFPLGKLRFSEIPTTGDTLKLVSLKMLADLPAISADMEFPPGYDRAIKYGLALELAPEYGVTVSNLIAAQFRDAISVLKRTNGQSRTGNLRVDGGLLNNNGYYDINDGPG